MEGGSVAYMAQSMGSRRLCNLDNTNATLFLRPESDFAVGSFHAPTEERRDPENF